MNCHPDSFMLLPRSNRVFLDSALSFALFYEHESLRNVFAIRFHLRLVLQNSSRFLDREDFLGELVWQLRS